MFPSFREQYLYNLFGILLHRKIVPSLPFPLSFINLFSHLFISEWTRAYLFYILDYNLILLYFVVKLFQLWLLGALSVGSYVSDLLPSMCGFFFSFLFEHFLTFWHYKVLQAYLVYFLSLSLKQPFLQRTLIPFDRAWSSLGQKLDWCCHLGLVVAKVTSVLYFCLLYYVNLHLLSLKRLLLAELCPLKFMC